MVPKEYEGLWRRTGIWRSNGTSDLTTQVWWFQSPRYHIDLRIPVDRIGITGFAGVTVVEGERCEWQPAIAFPAISTELDAGWMRFDDADHIHETGLDNSYEEDWYREPTGAMHGVRLEQVNGDAIAFLLMSEHWMAWACGGPGSGCQITVFHRAPQWTPVASNAAVIAVPELYLSQVLQWQAGEQVQAVPRGLWWRVAV